MKPSSEVKPQAAMQAARGRRSSEGGEGSVGLWSLSMRVQITCEPVRSHEFVIHLKLHTSMLNLPC